MAQNCAEWPQNCADTPYIIRNMSVFRRAARGADESAAGITGSDLESDSDLEAELTSLRNEGAPASGSGEETFGARIDAGALLSTDDDDDDGSSDGAETPVVVRQPSLSGWYSGMFWHTFVWCSHTTLPNSGGYSCETFIFFPPVIRFFPVLSK